VPAAQLRCCRVWRRDARVSMRMPVRWQYAEIRMEAMSIVSEASVARMSVIRLPVACDVRQQATA
jgi:hypothetical protein